MARALRIVYPGAFYHVASRRNERKNIFLNKRDREQFLSYLESATVRYGALIHVATKQSSSIKTNMLSNLYIRLNPVRAKIIPKPGEYEWSSCRAYAGLVSAPQWLHREFILSFFGAKEKTAQKRYRDFVERQAGRECPSPFEHVTASTLLGDESFVEWVREKFLKGAQIDRELPALRQLTGRPGLEAIRCAVEGLFLDDRAKARRVGLYLCRCHTALKLKEIGAAYGVGESAVTQASRRVAEEMKQNVCVCNSVGMLEKELVVSKV